MTPRSEFEKIDEFSDDQAIKSFHSGKKFIKDQNRSALLNSADSFRGWDFKVENEEDSAVFDIKASTEKRPSFGKKYSAKMRAQQPQNVISLQKDKKSQRRQV